MKDTDEFYRSLLDTNKETFAQGLFKVAYHALSGALYCALELHDREKLKEVERIAELQLGELQAQRVSESPARERLEVALYSSLIRIANPRHFFLLDEGTSPF